MAKLMKTEFKGSGCWLQQYPKTNRRTFDEVEGVEPLRKNLSELG
jgi:hypothetical protein